MSNHNFRRRSKYDKEMEQAFTLIFHNIKRLQDGQLCERGASHVSFDNQADLAPSLQRPRARSDPLNGPADGVLRQNMNHESGTRPKSRSFSGGKGSSPSSQGRKVTFADDYTAKDPTTAKVHTRTCNQTTNLDLQFLLTRHVWKKSKGNTFFFSNGKTIQRTTQIDQIVENPIA